MTRYIQPSDVRRVVETLPNGAVTSMTSIEVSSSEESIEIPYSYSKVWVFVLPAAAAALVLASLAGFVSLVF